MISWYGGSDVKDSYLLNYEGLSAVEGSTGKSLMLTADYPQVIRLRKVSFTVLGSSSTRINGQWAMVVVPDGFTASDLRAASLDSGNWGDMYDPADKCFWFRTVETLDIDNDGGPGSLCFNDDYGSQGPRITLYEGDSIYLVTTMDHATFLQRAWINCMFDILK
jgi:hypothetical protein